MDKAQFEVIRSALQELQMVPISVLVLDEASGAGEVARFDEVVVAVVEDLAPADDDHMSIEVWLNSPTGPTLGRATLHSQLIRAADFINRDVELTMTNYRMHFAELVQS